MRMRPLIMRLEAFVRWLTRGRMGVLDVAGLPSVQLTVPGRKTGIPRTTPLLYVPDGDRKLLVGSGWGEVKHPAWSANLKAATNVGIRERGQQTAATSRLLEGVERKEAWNTAVKFWPGYEMEHRRSGGREFRIFEIRV
ncbi:nitroreductase family deazaflavin-dependent oxidoreductase [Skermania sp. ID1734]|nr:nitroreductase family deazaflavin-dependent oxidoreductase [Skermania sp. ID1734]